MSSSSCFLIASCCVLFLSKMRSSGFNCSLALSTSCWVCSMILIPSPSSVCVLSMRKTTESAAKTGSVNKSVSASVVRFIVCSFLPDQFKHVLHFYRLPCLHAIIVDPNRGLRERFIDFERVISVACIEYINARARGGGRWSGPGRRKRFRGDRRPAG